jgi:hypothetical protein
MSWSKIPNTNLIDFFPNNFWPYFYILKKQKYETLDTNLMFKKVNFKTLICNLYNGIVHKCAKMVQKFVNVKYWCKLGFGLGSKK